MEHLDPKYFACTEPINIKNYFKKFSEELKAINNPISNNKEVKKLEKICSIDHLSHEGEINQTAIKTKLWKTMNLESTENSSHLKIQRMKHRWDKYNEMKVVLSFPADREEEEENPDEEDLISLDDIVVIVRLYKPFSSESKSRCDAKYTHEFAVLGRQKLCELRDVFKCVHDFGVLVELEHPDEKVTACNKDQYPSGFIFIENCFYNDTRHPNSIEYSKEIIEWSQRKNVGNFKTAKMEDTKIEDLNIRLGYPYVYQHQANCEHLLIFTDIRLLRPQEIHNSSKYPYVLSYNKFNRILCMMCAHVLAQYVITECDRLLAACNYMCKSCVLAYNYKEGKKIGEFKLYPYYDINMTSLF